MIEVEFGIRKFGLPFREENEDKGLSGLWQKSEND